MDPVLKLRDDEEEKSQKELDDLRLQLLNYEVYTVYNRRENLRFYGVPEIEEEENTEAVLKAFLEKELNVGNTQYIEFQRVHRVGKRDRNTRQPRAISLAGATSTTSRILVLALIYLSRWLIWERGLSPRWCKQEKMEKEQPLAEWNLINSLLIV